MALDKLLAQWRTEQNVGGNISAWHTIPARVARFSSFPDNLHPMLQIALQQIGIHALFSHQKKVWQVTKKGQHSTLITDTASGKTLGYNLPIFDQLLRSPDHRALYLFPTKALAQDQLAGMEQIFAAANIKDINAALYDGDTPRNTRGAVRKNSRIIISNPDMLHIGILPHHTVWIDFFQNLRFVVVDEMHNYRGVFGSHVANVIRRLKRITHYYGAHPQFLLTSATIDNPQEMASKLIEEPVICIDQDGSARGPKHFIIYNPPIINFDLGLRASVLNECVRLVRDLLDHNLQTIVFGRTRRSVEIMLKTLRENLPSKTSNTVRAYRSGYLPKHRREIERRLRTAEVRAVIATTALELGIDIGGLNAAVLAGYPGTIAGTWQQVGRAGRGTDASLAVLVASSNPIDQYLARHPNYFFQRTPEQALINPDNLLILIQHIQCAAFELSFSDGESFGSLDPSQVLALLSALLDSGILHHSGGKFFWMADQYPAAQISLRSTSSAVIQLQCIAQGSSKTFGKVDRESAPWMVHPGAIYLHEGDSYRVDTLDFERDIATLKSVDVDYFTFPQQKTEVQLQKLKEIASITGGTKSHGEIVAISQVVGFQKFHWETKEKLGTEKLDMPPSELYTTGYWLSLSEETINSLQTSGLWNNAPGNYGPAWKEIATTVRNRDHHRCQICGIPETKISHHVHHKQPLRDFESYHQANRLGNLITLCPSCHQRAEQIVRIRSGLAGAVYTLSHVAPFILMCDSRDLSSFSDTRSPLSDGQATIVIYELIPAGIGYAQRLFERHDQLIDHAFELVSSCICTDGCPSCVGPGGEQGTGGKQETLAIFNVLRPI
jgi:DEAD/DEAH box helicase domain-containing protein